MAEEKPRSGGDDDREPQFLGSRVEAKNRLIWALLPVTVLGQRALRRKHRSM